MDICDVTKIASFCRKVARSPPNLHSMVPSLVCIQNVLKVEVEVKDHAIPTLL